MKNTLKEIGLEDMFNSEEEAISWITKALTERRMEIKSTTLKIKELQKDLWELTDSLKLEIIHEKNLIKNLKKLGVSISTSTE